MTRRIVIGITLLMILSTLPNLTDELNTVEEATMETSARDSWADGEFIHEFPEGCGWDDDDTEICDSFGVDFVVNSTGVTRVLRHLLR